MAFNIYFNFKLWLQKSRFFFLNGPTVLHRKVIKSINSTPTASWGPLPCCLHGAISLAVLKVFTDFDAVVCGLYCFLIYLTVHVKLKSCLG